jgi:hypothetical protein
MESLSLASTWSIELAKCNYCGDSTDSIRRSHPACEEDFQLGEVQIAMEVAAAVSVGGDMEGLPARVAIVASQARISALQLRGMVVAAWVRAVEKFLQVKVLNEDEERRLIRLEYLFGLTQADLDASDAWQYSQADAA